MNPEIEEWIYLNYGQESYHPGLERINSALSEIKEKLQLSQVITIVGTNGKGETTHRLSHHLKDSTFCSWTSPHIESITERFSSESGDIDEKELEKFIHEGHELCQKNHFKLSYYEFLFFVFCRWAAQKSPKYILLEVGLGGKLDAVNALDAGLVLLTSISRDHQEFLGHRYDQILREKLGVLRPGSTLISFVDLQYLRERTKRECEKHGAHLIDLEEIMDFESYEFSFRNQFLAHAAYCFLQKKPITSENWSPSSINLSSRGEIIMGANQWWLFGSHNVDGMRKLIQFLHSANYNSRDVPFNAIVTSFSKRDEKDLKVMLRMLKASELGEVLVTSFDHPKAFPREALRDLSCHEGLKFVEDVSDHIQTWTHQKVLVVGSYYFLGQLKPLLRNR